MVQNIQTYQISHIGQETPALLCTTQFDIILHNVLHLQ